MESRKLNIFGITFSNKQGVFYAGQCVEGLVTIDVNVDMLLQGVHLLFEGKAHVNWTSLSYSPDTSTYGNVDYYTKRCTNATTQYENTEQYFKEELTLFGEGPGNPHSTFKTPLPMGHHTFPFSYKLPSKLPSSFESEFGYVRFGVKVVISRPWKFDIYRKRLFTVISLVDLNKDPRAKMPVQEQRERMTGCLCFNQGQIAADLQLEHRGFVPGEGLPLTVNITNNSSGKVSTSADLTMETTYYSTVIGKKVMTEVGHIDGCLVKAGTSGSFSGQTFNIPPLPPSQLVGCKIIHIKYVLQLHIDPSYPDLNIPVDLIIGTLPLRKSVKKASRHHHHHHHHHHAAKPGPQAGYPTPREGGEKFSGDNAGTRTGPSAAPPPHANIAPPSYSECMFGKVTLKDDDDLDNIHSNHDYAPMYACYNFKDPPPAAPTFQTLVEFL